MKQINKIFFVLIAILLSGVMEMAAQTRKVVSGTVTELLGTSAEPLVGVNVNIVNNQNRSLGGGITNLNGQYNVTIPEGETNLTIVFSYIGMQTKRIKYTGQTLLNVRMDSDTKSIDQVEVT
ncbi:carboxypeptidase-like regulatory domain-containing protein, partial [Dysgonomonas sp.]